jgi:hypothetical protein
MEREQVDREVSADLKKSYNQLIGDVYEQLLSPRPPEYTMLQAQKKMMTLFAKIGFDSSRAQSQMIRLTWAVVILTGFVVLFGLLQVILFHK